MTIVCRCTSFLLLEAGGYTLYTESLKQRMRVRSTIAQDHSENALVLGTSELAIICIVGDGGFAQRLTHIHTSGSRKLKNPNYACYPFSRRATR